MKIEISQDELSLYAHYRLSVDSDLAFLMVARLAGVNFDDFLGQVVDDVPEQTEAPVEVSQEA